VFGAENPLESIVLLPGCSRQGAIQPIIIERIFDFAEQQRLLNLKRPIEASRVAACP
jgi:hypothetical protein